MYFNTICNDILKHLPHRALGTLITQHQTDRYRKTYTTKDHLVVLLVAQLSSCKSLRDLEVLFNQHPSLRYHMGLRSIKRSTVSDAHNSIDSQVFRDMALLMLKRLSTQKKELTHVLTALDSSLIRAEGRGNQWSKGSRAGSCGLKLHVQYDHTHDHIDYVELSDANINDITIAQTFKIDPQRIYVFDKGYFDYNWWKSIQDQNARFVTRLKKNSAYQVLQDLPISLQDQGFILKDQIIVLTNKHPRGGKINHLAGQKLRLVQVKHPDTSRLDPLLIVTNALDLEAEVIAGFYKQRWSVELVFKWLKQHLNLKSFLGESRQALMNQLYASIIAYVLLKLYKAATNPTMARLKDVVTLVRNGIFNRPQAIQYAHKKQQFYDAQQPPLFALNNPVRHP